MLTTLLTAELPAQASGPEHCTASARRWLAVSTPAGDDDLVSWADVVRHVGSELLLREVELCSAPKPSPALASLRLSRSGVSGVTIALWGVEPVQLLGERTLELGPVPADARLLSIAVAADELLATNLRELERRTEAARARREAREARRTRPAPPAPVQRESRDELGLAFVGDVFGGGQALLGADAHLHARLGRRFAAGFRLGLRQGLATRAEHGSVEARALVLGLLSRFEALAGERLKLDLLARADGFFVDASAYPSAGATGHGVSGFALTAGGGLGVRGVLSRSLQLSLDGTVGGAWRPLHLTDTGQRISGLSGVAVSAGGGVLVLF
jgi:hypothetical protein